MVANSNVWVTVILVALALLLLPSTLAECPYRTECLDFLYKGPSIEDCIDDGIINKIFEFCMEDNSSPDTGVFVVNEIGKMPSQQRSLRMLVIPGRRLQGGCRRCGGNDPPPPDCCRRRDMMVEQEATPVEESATPLKDSGAFDEVAIGRCLCSTSNFYMGNCGTISECSFQFCG